MIWIIIIVIFVLFLQGQITENFRGWSSYSRRRGRKLSWSPFSYQRRGRRWGWAPYSWGHGWDRWQGRRGPRRHRYDWAYNS